MQRPLLPGSPPPLIQPPSQASVTPRLNPHYSQFATLQITLDTRGFINSSSPSWYVWTQKFDITDDGRVSSTHMSGTLYRVSDFSVAVEEKPKDIATKIADLLSNGENIIWEDIYGAMCGYVDAVPGREDVRSACIESLAWAFWRNVHQHDSSHGIWADFDATSQQWILRAPGIPELWERHPTGSSGVRV
ncbi:hypothetical protein QFC21_006181 [Naganishia friedmannii]|uniref:Uncharacterized protein n=1 Tax=Naganishia friedmannii TaxID=89922 RepID=A0ACC2V581_9TREE|nr:hypothetical protein QFC21_006181 [Naganishia friedmannii]